MTAPASSRPAQERWWLDDERKARVGPFVARLVMAAVAVTWLAAALALVVVDQAHDRAAREHELMFASALGVAQPGAVGPMVKASGGEAILVEPGRTRRLYPGPDSIRDRRYDRWRTRVGNTALARDTGRQFDSTDPDGRRWHHTRVPTSSEADLVLGVRDNGRLAVGEPAATAVLAMAVGVTLGLALLWRSLSTRLVDPIGILVDGGEDLLLRGSLRPETRQAVLNLPSPPIQLHRLGQLLDRIGTDFGHSTRRNESLLAASNALGSLLDPEAVLTRSLEHLQRLLDVDRSAILQYDPRTRMFNAVATLGHDESYVRDLSAAAHDSAMPSVRATRELRPIQVPDIESGVISSDLLERGRRHGYRSLLAVPLPHDLEHPTVLVLHSTRPRAYSFDEIELCRSFASVSGAALRNAELYARTDQRLQKQTSTLEAIIDSVDQGLVVESTGGDIVFTNATMSGLVASITGAEISDDRTDSLVSRLLGPGHGTGGHDLLSTLQPCPESWADLELRCRDGRHCLFRVRTFPVRDSRGAEVGRGYTWTDISRDRELERMKEGLLAAVSHEFRTPLALIKGYATTLLADDVRWGPEDSRRFLAMISGEADRLADLVQRLLDMRRIDAGMVQLELMPTALGTIVAAAIEGVPHEPGRIMTAPIPQATIDCDAARLTTALRNLIENACRYSPDDEPVTVMASVTGGTAEIAVIDRGPGIDPAVRNHIFDTFVRGHDTDTNDDGAADERRVSTTGRGIGLGLSIARGFVEAHRGSLRVDDGPDGRGSIFRVTLPAGAADLDEAAVVPAMKP